MSDGLEVDALEVAYGKTAVVHDVALRVRAGEFVALLGANGAGKSTTLGAICGFVTPAGGSVRIDGADVTRWSPERRAKAGAVAVVPEGRRLFSDQSVEANLLIGAYRHRRDQAKVRDLLAAVYALFPKLERSRSQRSGGLSGGEQQMVAIGRALMTDTRVLLLDEPSLGLAPLVIREVFAALAALREQGRAVLLVEQRVEEALGLVDRAYVLERGRVVLEGTGAELAASPALVNAYLGEGEHPGRAKIPPHTDRSEEAMR